MNYKISNVRLAGHRWKLDLEYWKKSDCSCSAKKIELELEQKNKPSLRDAIKAFNSFNSL